MKISQATALIRTPLIEWSRPQSWCDLGCGSGTFTTALALLLASGSTIHAVDLDQGALEGIPDQYNGVAIRKILGDLRSSSVRLPSVDGILMANFLHFIREQHLFLRRLLSLTTFPDCGVRAVQAESVGTLSGRLREALRTLQRGRSGACGETGNTAIAV